MSKGGSSSPPPSVDPTLLGAEQLQANLATAQKQSELNNVNTTSPFGTSFFNQDANGRWNLSQSLSPLLQGAFGNAANLSQLLSGFGGDIARLASSPAGGGSSLIDNALNFLGGQIPRGPVSTEGLPGLQGSLDFSGLNPIPRSGADFSSEVGKAQDAAYNSQAQYLDPQFAQKNADLRQQLADEGVGRDSTAFSRSTGDLGRQEDLAYQGARDAAVAAGNAEQGKLYGQALSSRQEGAQEAQAQGAFQNAARNQGFGERVTQWGEPLAALASAAQTGEGILSGATGELAGLDPFANFGWGGQIPTFGGSPTSITPANFASIQGAANTGDFNRFLAGNQLNNQLFNGIGSLGGALGFGNGGLGSALGLGSTSGNGLFGAGGLLGGSAVQAGEGGIPLLAGAADASGGVGLDTIISAAPLAGWIICTELMKQERLPRRYWAAGTRAFAAYPQIARDGYHVWAVPSVRHLRAKPFSPYSRLLERVFGWRAENIAAHAGVRGARKLWRGAAVTVALAPLCLVLGALCRVPDWRSLYSRTEARANG